MRLGSEAQRSLPDLSFVCELSYSRSAMNRYRLQYSADNCSIKRTLDVIGEKWTLLVLRETFLGVRRFEDFQRIIGCARNILSARLATLVDEEILAREPYREPGSRTRYEYSLTEKGRELFPALIALMQWGDRWAADPEGAPLELRHRDCEQPVGVTMTCAAGHGPLGARDTHAVPGPGARLVA
jgi:DNA-binding HxlR family transcriptional regulator